MLIITNPIPWKRSKVPFSLTQTATAVSTTDASSYSFATQSIGTADSTRIVIVAVDLDAADATAVTVGGISASLVVRAVSATRAEIWQAAVPTGTTATVAITCGANFRCAITVWRMVGANATVNNTNTDLAHSSGILTATLTIPTGGGGVGNLFVSKIGASGAIPWTWTNMTEGVDAIIEGDRYYTSALSTTAGAAQTITATATGGTLDTVGTTVMALAAWGP